MESKRLLTGTVYTSITKIFTDDDGPKGFFLRSYDVGDVNN